LRRAQEIRQCLGGSANMMKPFPKKSKGMSWWNTFELMWWEHYEAEMGQLVRMMEWLDKFERRMAE
jgi:hypothetical protein